MPEIIPGVIVCIGVLIDTLLVRTVIVPAMAFIAGDKFWWPRRPPVTDAEAAPSTETEVPRTRAERKRTPVS